MAKPKKAEKPSKLPSPSEFVQEVRSKELPICAALLICENVLISKDEVASAIRIVNKVTIKVEKELEMGIPFGIGNLQLLAMLKNGGAHGNFDVFFSSIDPSGKDFPLGVSVVTLEGPPENGGTLIGPLVVGWGGNGLYWIQLQINNAVVTKIPLSIIVDVTKPPIVSDKPEEV